MAENNPIKIGKIQITLARKGDGSLPEPVKNSLGEVITGPQGLLNLLETQLGIPSSDVSFTTRLIQYLGCIEQMDQQGAFYHKSYEADPFSVARTLLQWRDQWHEVGWDGTFKEGVPTKLADMATIETLAKDSVEPNVGQRIQRIIELLTDNPIAIESITLRDPLRDFPHLWQRLIEATGAGIIELNEPVPQADEDTDLGRLQRHLLTASNEKIPLRGDSSVTVLQADSAQDSTCLAALLAQRQLAKSPDNTLAILAERRGDLLDEALEAIGAPRLGFSVLSTWRPVFQVLPLACELLWEPLNPTALFQFLSHPVGPIPARQREQLAKTAASTPGIGSEAWEQAIAQCLEAEEEKDRQRFDDNIRYWLESHRHAPQTGVDGALLAERAERVATWLTGAREASDEPALQSLYGIALNQAKELVKAIERLREHGRDTLTRDNVLRLIEDVRGTGAPVADRQAEVSPGQARAYPAAHAGTFHTPVDQVIWWDCQAADAVQRWPWSRTERAALANHGVILQGEDEQLEWLGKAWLRPILCAKEQCFLILHSDAERHHPVWDLVNSLTEGLAVLPATAPDTTGPLVAATGPGSAPQTQIRVLLQPGRLHP
jgi:hypothetical protein